MPLQLGRMELARRWVFEYSGLDGPSLTGVLKTTVQCLSDAWRWSSCECTQVRAQRMRTLLWTKGRYDPDA